MVYIRAGKGKEFENISHQPISHQPSAIKTA